MESIIEEIKHELPINAEIVAKVTGKKTYHKPTYYVHKESNEQFSHIAGGIAWPGEITETGIGVPGFAVIVGVVKSDFDMPVIRVLEEVEENSIDRLLQECIQLREKYGFGEFPGILSYWYGDHEKFVSFLNELNLKARTEDVAGLYVSPPADFDQPNAFEIYIRRLQQYIEAGKIQNLGKALRHYLRASTIDSPAVLALSYTVHSLMIQKPWRRAVNAEHAKYYISFD